MRPDILGNSNWKKAMAARILRRISSLLLSFCLYLLFDLSLAPSAYPANITDDELNLYCLRLSYPLVDDLFIDDNGNKWLTLKNGARVPYDTIGSTPSLLHTGIAESMREPYPLEPERPPTPDGIAPGRKRPYEFLYALYGHDSATVKQKLAPCKFAGKTLHLNENASRAFMRAVPELEKIRTDKKMRPFLKPDGGYCWRKIAGENVPSAHSFGIAIDLGADKAPYWRWSKIMPHPMQQTYPREIVELMEKHGFIWGGKWHEYDLMHFEYRPELICKARILARMRNNSSASPTVNMQKAFTGMQAR